MSVAVRQTDWSVYQRPVSRVGQGAKLGVAVSSNTAGQRQINCRNKLIVAIPAAFLFLALLFQLFVRVSTINAAYEVSELRKEALVLDRELRKERLEYAYWSRPAAIGKAAEEQFGMVPLTPGRVRRLSANKITTND